MTPNRSVKIYNIAQKTLTIVLKSKFALVHSNIINKITEF